MFTTYAMFVRDSNVFVEEPKILFQTGQFKHCNILTGSNNYEELNMVDFEIPEYAAGLREGSLISFKKIIEKRLNIKDSPLVDKVIDLYVPRNEIKDVNKDYFLYYVQIVTDYQYRCSAYQLAENYAKFNQNSFVYLYGHKSSKDTQQLVDGASHTDELEFIFGDPLKDELNYTCGEKNFSKTMINYWSSFVKSGIPTLNNEWLQFNAGSSSRNRNLFFLKSTKITNTNYSINDPICKFWSDFPFSNNVNNANKSKASFYLNVCLFVSFAIQFAIYF